MRAKRLATYATILLISDMKAVKKAMTDTQMDEVAKLFAVLADSSRLRLPQCLMHREQTVTDLIEATVE